MKKVAILLIILAIGVGGFYAYTQFATQSIVVIDKTDGEVSEIKINLNVKDNKKEEIKKEEPVEQPKEEIKPVEDIKEIDSGDVAVPKKVYSEFDILKYMSNERNYMISPFSLKMALMMTANGATGETQEEMLESFGIEDISAYNQKAEELINRYNSAEDVKLNVANSIWLNKDIA